MNEAVIFRAIERILAVVIGGICIYLGYRLFLGIHEQKEGEGKVEFPGGVSIFVARVGPGVFFALFGAAVAGISIYKGIEVQSMRTTPAVSEDKRASGGGPSASQVEQLEFKGASAAMADSEREARADARATLRKEFAILNNLSGYLRADLPEQDRSLIELAIPRIKLALMKPVWGDRSEGWGDPAAFEQWQKNGEPEPPAADLKTVVEYYRYGKRDKR